MQFHYTYRITNNKLNKHYYGVRSSRLQPINDLGVKYFSSSFDKEFIQDQKENPKNYKYKVIKIFKTRKEAINFEIKLHAKFNVDINESFYNRARQTSNKFSITKFGHKMSEETKEKISNTLKGRKRSKESIEKQKESYKKENHYMYGKKRSKELSMSIGEKIKKPVKLINKDGNIIMKTDSITKMLDYLRKNNIPTTIIHRYLNKPFKSNRNKEYNMWTCTYVQK